MNKFQLQESVYRAYLEGLTTSEISEKFNLEYYSVNEIFGKAIAERQVKLHDKRKQEESAEDDSFRDSIGVHLAAPGRHSWDEDDYCPQYKPTSFRHLSKQEKMIFINYDENEFTYRNYESYSGRSRT